MSKTATATKAKSTKPIVDSLKTVLADSYALLGQTHIAHWNVEGPAFFSLHAAFQTQYEELFIAVDDIAERIRGLDEYSPGGLKTLASLSSISELDAEAIPAKDYVAHLIECNEIVGASLRTARDTAAEKGDPQTEDLMIGRIQVHDKALWMLRSFLKNL
ncbi:Dps family protein [Luteolibacter sp. AS25]|uniref:Dps family protein n=1 Tax=Luteolibacter sp. AS25 TaxID=3135776 RepID=UPI00398B3237